MRKKYIFTFQPELLGLFVFNNLVKGFDFWFNILRANIKPDIGGKLILEFSGEDGKIEEGVSAAKNAGVMVSPLEDELKWDRELCEDCGACISACPYQAISMDREKFQLNIDFGRCIACGACDSVCPVDAIKLNF